MSYEQNVEQKISYEYDFAVDGGAVGDIDLRALVANEIKSGLVIKEAIIHIETALVSASGSATIGDGTDDDGIFLDLVAKAAGSYSSLNLNHGGALLAEVDTTLDGRELLVADANTAPQLVIATGAVTAGKFKVDFICYQK